MAVEKNPKTSFSKSVSPNEVEATGGGEGADPIGVKKTTVSFHASEQSQVDQILDILFRTKRHRGGFSDAIKIALRLCPLDSESIANAWEQARAQDGRVSRHRKKS